MSSIESKGAKLLRTMRSGLSHYRETTFPGAKGMRITIVPLSMGELQEAQADAEDRFKALRIEVNALNASDLNTETQIQVLARAIRDPDDRGERLFKSASELRSLITADELGALVDEYLVVQEEANPRPEQVSDELFEVIEAAIKKKDTSILSSIGSRTLASYLLSTASPPSN